MAEHVTVMIVGAGPTGLMMANLLAQQGIECRIIDKKPEATQTSNALGIHARSLEMLDDINLVEPFLKAGFKAQRICFNTPGKLIAEFDFKKIPSHFNEILILPQCITEKILTDSLQNHNIEVERNSTLLKLTNHPDKVSIEINTPRGIEAVSCNWLIAADGAHSTARHLLNIPFAGEALAQHFMVADVHANQIANADAANLFFGKINTMAVFPIRPQIYRLVLDLPQSDLPEVINQDYIQNLVDQCCHKPFKIDTLVWHSKFSINTRMINQLKSERVFFMGDAAHIHSPAGGQGMNTGMQDAYNLAWKLAMTCKQQTKKSILTSYQAERIPVIKDVLEISERMTKFGFLKNSLFNCLRRQMLKRVSRNKRLHALFINRMSQLSLHYSQSPIICYHYRASRQAPRPGTLTPDVNYTTSSGQPARLKTELRGLQHHLLLFCSSQFSEQDEAAILDTLEIIQSRYRKTIKPIIIVTKAAEHKFNQLDAVKIFDLDLIIHRTYGVNRSSQFLIRPDNYIAYATNNLDSGKLIGFIGNILNAR